MLTRPRRSAVPLTATVAATLVLGALTTAVAAPATAAASGRVAVSPCLNLRAGASGATQLLGCIPVNTTITIECTARGSSVTGPWGASTVWDRTTWAGLTGFVSDAWVFTGTSNPVAADCDTAQPTPPPAVTREAKAHAWAQGQLGKVRDDWGRLTSGWCARWSVGAYGRQNSGYNTAYDMWRAFRAQGLTRGGTAPAGTFVFFGPARVNGGAGHVAIADGAGGMITTTGVYGQARPVERRPLSYANAPYLGWSYAPPSWSR